MGRGEGGERRGKMRTDGTYIHEISRECNQKYYSLGRSRGKGGEGRRVPREEL